MSREGSPRALLSLAGRVAGENEESSKGFDILNTGNCPAAGNPDGDQSPDLLDVGINPLRLEPVRSLSPLSVHIPPTTRQTCPPEPASSFNVAAAPQLFSASTTQIVFVPAFYPDTTTGCPTSQPCENCNMSNFIRSPLLKQPDKNAVIPLRKPNSLSRKTTYASTAANDSRPGHTSRTTCGPTREKG